MNIKKVPLHLLRPSEDNAKYHPVQQLNAVMDSIERFGMRQPIVIDKNNVIVAGHARYEALAALGWDEAPCELADDLTEDQINEYRILDNLISELGATDVKKLQIAAAKVPNIDLTPFKINPLADIKIKAPELNKSIKEEKQITCPQCDHVFTL
jgi:ParB family chromosome partitioning protein